MTVSYQYARSNEPVQVATVSNPKGYLDLKVFKRTNGKAISIAKRDGSELVNIGVDRIDALIEALQAVKTRGVKTAEDQVSFR